MTDVDKSERSWALWALELEADNQELRGRLSRASSLIGLGRIASHECRRLQEKCRNLVRERDAAIEICTELVGDFNAMVGAVEVSNLSGEQLRELIKTELAVLKENWSELLTLATR